MSTLTAPRLARSRNPARRRLPRPGRHDDLETAELLRTIGRSGRQRRADRRPRRAPRQHPRSAVQDAPRRPPPAARLARRPRPHDHLMSRITALAAGEPEISCDECFDVLDIYVELMLAGSPADERFPGMCASTSSAAPRATRNSSACSPSSRVRTPRTPAGREEARDHSNVGDHAEHFDERLGDDHGGGQRVLVAEGERERQHDQRVAGRAGEYQGARRRHIEPSARGEPAPTTAMITRNAT